MYYHSDEMTSASGMQPILRDDTAYWKQYWELFDSVEEVNTLITPQHGLFLHVTPSSIYPQYLILTLVCSPNCAAAVPR